MGVGILIVLGSVAVLGSGAFAAHEVGSAADKAAKPIKWLVAGGVVYVGYQALKSGGAIK